jgi:YbgC/YbaW family acyl-CoA thioester hydrolase
MATILPINVVGFETDFAGFVSNTRYIEYLERGRYALLQSQGLTVTELWNTHGVQPVVRRTEVDYLGLARHEDQLELHTSVVEHSGATTLLHHELRRPADGAVLLRATQTLAYVNTKWRPVRVPAIYREVLAAEKG